MERAHQWTSVGGTVLAGVLAVAVNGCDEPGLPVTVPGAIDVTTAGRILDFVTQAPIAGAAVRFGLSFDQPNLSEAKTSTDGRYTLTVPRPGAYTVSVNGAFAGSVHVTGREFHGDIFISTGTCRSRYGFVIDGRTLQPVGGATIELNGRTMATTGADGWYRIDGDCPAELGPGTVNVNTTVISATHPDYQMRTASVGRGFFRVERLDLDLTRR